uniref:Caveolin n=1 Tax=Lates calcarifer TaxID=8187 RepID=A0A4W6DCV9_LATCA
MVSDDCLVDDVVSFIELLSSNIAQIKISKIFLLKIWRPPYMLLSSHVEVSDVLAEPPTPRSIDLVWLYSVIGFERARIWTYRCLTLLFAVPFALLCGIFLAILASLHVWYAGASIRQKNFLLSRDGSSCLLSSLQTAFLYLPNMLFILLSPNQ